MPVRYRGIRSLGLMDPAERSNSKRMDRTLRDIVAQLTRVTQRQQTIFQQLQADPGLVRYGEFVNRPQANILYQHNVQFMLYFATDTDQLFAWDGLIWVEIGGGGVSGLDLAFFDDFMATPGTDPFPGASGTWRLGSSAGGGSSSVVTDVNNSDLTAFGVWRLQSGTAVGGSHVAISPEDSTTFPLTLATGMEIGARIRIDSSNFTRGLFSFGLTDANISGSNSQQGTVRAAFVIWVTDTDYFTAGGLGQDIAIFETASAAGAANYSSLNTGATGSSFTGFTNIKMIVRAPQVLDCYKEGFFVGTIAGATVPSTSQKLSLRIRQQTNGIVNPGTDQQSYIDRIYIDTSNVTRGSN